mmetsp:Transcript_26151/g.83076  ORF Transcript_26151/g.83076 Transcript_26151/m.83076 type:complete len:355 (-) Transcript_26151:56-1120(-)
MLRSMTVRAGARRASSCSLLRCSIGKLTSTSTSLHRRADRDDSSLSPLRAVSRSGASSGEAPKATVSKSIGWPGGSSRSASRASTIESIPPLNRIPTAAPPQPPSPPSPPSPPTPASAGTPHTRLRTAAESAARRAAAATSALAARARARASASAFGSASSSTCTTCSSPAPPFRCRPTGIRGSSRQPSRLARAAPSPAASPATRSPTRTANTGPARRGCTAGWPRLGTGLPSRPPRRCRARRAPRTSTSPAPCSRWRAHSSPPRAQTCSPSSPATPTSCPLSARCCSGPACGARTSSPARARSRGGIATPSPQKSAPPSSPSTAYSARWPPASSTCAPAAARAAPTASRTWTA